MRHRGIALRVGLLPPPLLFFSTETEPRAWHVLNKHFVAEQETNPRAAFFICLYVNTAVPRSPVFFPFFQHVLI